MPEVNAKIKIYSAGEYKQILPKTIISNVAGLSTALSEKQATSEKNVAHGYPGLDANAKILVDRLPDVAITGMSFKDTIGTNTSLDIYTGDEPTKGWFWIVTQDITFTATNTRRFKTNDGLKTSGEVYVQIGDWVVTLENDGTTVTLGIVENNQADRFLAKAGGVMSGHIGLDKASSIQNALSVQSRRVVLDEAYGNSGTLEVAFNTATNPNYLRNVGGNLVTKNGMDDNIPIVNTGRLKADIEGISGDLDVDISGSAASATQATKLAIERTISVSGAVTGSTTFDGSANRAIATTINFDGLDVEVGGMAAITLGRNSVTIPTTDTIQSAISKLSIASESVIKAVVSATQPTGSVAGDIWFDTSG